MAKKRDIVETTQNTGTPSVPSRSWFFGIGINAYDQFDSLNNAVRDVEDILALLQERYDINEVITLYDEKANRVSILDQFENMVDEVQAEDKLLIYYSGHGYLRGETGYWIPIDGKQGSRGSFIRDATIRDCIKNINAKHILLISDSCFSGSLVTREVGREGLAIEELEKDRSRWVISSGRQREKVADGTPGKNSPFASSILKVLQNNELAKLNVAYLSDKVTKLTRFNYEQLPQGSPLFGVGHEGGQYVFSLRQAAPPWKKDWSFIANHPEETLNQIHEKILLLDEYLDVHSQAENLNEAVIYGELLEQKQGFFQARISLFRLKQFARKNTPFKEEALKLIEKFKKGYSLPKDEPIDEETKLKEEIQPPKRKKKTKPSAIQPTPKKTRPLIVDNSFTDSRDGQVYKTIELNDQTWMAENLNFDVGKDCWFYDDDPKNGEKYGCLYTWEAAKKACPPGWRLPTDEEWKALMDSFGDSTKAYKALLKGGSSGFSALLGGYRTSDGYFHYLERLGYYWSATEYDAVRAWDYFFDSDDGELGRNDYSKLVGRSCRCLKD